MLTPGDCIMKQKTWKPYAFWILLAEGVGALSGWLTREDTKQYGKTIASPPLSPPALVFPVVWGILFFLMGVGAARIYRAPPSAMRTRSLLLFLVQLAFNFGWSILFFHFRRFGLALLWLLVLWGQILWMMFSFFRVDKVAAWLQIPYLLWVTFAAYLNWGVWVLN